MYGFLRSDALKHFRWVVRPHAASPNEAFWILSEHFNTLTHQWNNKDEWSRFIFSILLYQNLDNSGDEFLQLLYYRVQDLLALLNPPYSSDLLHCDLLVRATSTTPFPSHLTDEDAEPKLHALYTQRLNAINRESREKNELM